MGRLLLSLRDGPDPKGGELFSFIPNHLVPCRRGIHKNVHFLSYVSCWSTFTTDSVVNFVTYIFEEHPVCAYIFCVLGYPHIHTCIHYF